MHPTVELFGNSLLIVLLSCELPKWYSRHKEQKRSPVLADEQIWEHEEKRRYVCCPCVHIFCHGTNNESIVAWTCDNCPSVQVLVIVMVVGTDVYVAVEGWSEQPKCWAKLRPPSIGVGHLMLRFWCQLQRYTWNQYTRLAPCVRAWLSIVCTTSKKTNPTHFSNVCQESLYLSSPHNPGTRLCFPLFIRRKYPKWPEGSMDFSS